MEYRTLDRISEVDAGQWDRLNRGGYPFLRHAFLDGLERTGCVGPDTGWRPRHIVLFEDQAQQRLLGAAPLYLKYHSYGEYVFDWAWADAYRRAGLPYYPKLLCAVPFTPATGPRLLVSPDAREPDAVQRSLIDATLELAQSLDLSSAHWLFTDRSDTHALENAGLLKRTGNQFHWSNQGYGDFQDYLAGLTSKRRKQIRRERRQVDEAGLTVRMIEGRDLETRHWDAMHRFYQTTIAERGAIPYLGRELFQYLAGNMKEHTIIALAGNHRDEIVAGALYFRGDDTLYGRYWGASAFYEGLHFETCYYQPIDYCVRHGIGRFEAGAQGEHKLSRGLVPTPTYSAHWLAHPEFKRAIREFLTAETHQIERYARILDLHKPFRRDS